MYNVVGSGWSMRSRMGLQIKCPGKAIGWALLLRQDPTSVNIVNFLFETVR